MNTSDCDRPLITEMAGVCVSEPACEKEIAQLKKTY